jgi:DNA-binding response OmpR family regulator
VQAEILVVENNAPVRVLLGVSLQREGLSVRLASGLAEAVEVYGERRATIGAVLLDVVLDDGDGPQTLARLREIDPSVRCCFITAGTSAYSEAALLALGALRVFTKPVSDHAEMARALEAVIRG